MLLQPFFSRSIFLFLWLICTVGVYSQTGNITAIWANDGGDKVTQDELRASDNPTSVLNNVWDGQKITLFGAKNEVVSFNLIIEAKTHPTGDINITIDKLTGPQGETIQSHATSGDGVFNWIDRPIELFFIRYLEIKGISTDLFFAGYDYDERHIPERFRRPWTGVGEGSGTWTDRPDHNKHYPDIAVPLELVQNFSIAACQCQSVWVDVTIPKSTPPGVYSGVVDVQENGSTESQIPVQLTIRNFTLPDTPYAKTMLFLGYEDINDRYLGEVYPTAGSVNDDESRLIRDRHFQLAHRHRISLIDGSERSVAQSDGNPMDQPHSQWLPRLDGSLFTAVNGYDGPGVNVGNGIYSIGTYGSWSWQGEGETAMRNHSDRWVDWFAANAPETEYFLYLIDESDNFPQIQQWARWINDNPGPGKSLMSMATMPMPPAKVNTPDLDIPTSWFNVGKTDEWQNAVDHFENTPDKRVYFYNSNRPASGSFAIEEDGVALRELTWGQYKMGIDRWFYWESTYYNNFQGNTGQTNVFRTAHTFGNFEEVDPVIGETGWNYLNGDGVLFYPGTDTRYAADSYGVKGPFASLRLKHWRRGIQDVDYLTLAAAVDPDRVSQIVDEMVPKALWEYGVTDPNDPTWVLTDISWSTDPDDWEEARAELADIIESANVSVPRQNIRPSDIVLYPNSPNPFNPSTVLKYELSHACRVVLKIYNVRGEETATLIDQHQVAGSHHYEWKPKYLSSGIYIVRLRAGEIIQTKKIVFQK